MLSDTALKQTPLNSEHIKLNAKMVPFGGWDMPLSYEGILAEYHSTRREVAIFDTSHMGEFFIEGDLRESGFDRLVTQRLDDLAVGACRYGLLLDDNGHTLDDLIVYRLADKKWMVVVNGATMEKDAGQFSRFITSKGKFTNASFATGKVDIQGPGSRALLVKFIKGFEHLAFYTFAECDVLGIKAIVSRTGYTGELGYEIYFPWERTTELWKKVLSLGAKPAGLGSRDVLRLEMGYSLYGHELSEQISPLEAGLERFIDWNKDFIGKTALQKEKAVGVKRSMVAFTSTSRRSPRGDFKIFSEAGQDIGIVTSGTFSPALERGIGLGLVETGFLAKDQKIYLGPGGEFKNALEAVITPRTFYKKGTLRQ